MKEYLIAGNWKMFKTPTEAVALAKELVKECANSKNGVMIAPSFVCLSQVAEVVKGSNIQLAAQNMASVEEGAHTGETSVLMLKDLGVSAVLLGHSERRSLYHEGNDLINTKVKLALKHGLKVVFCIGETLKEREAGQANVVCASQIQEGLAGISATEMEKIVVAYEPVWAIGTGKTATPADAQAVHAAIRGEIANLYSPEVAQKTIIQYGGSVKPNNVVELMNENDINGALVGGASLEASSFSALVNFNL